MSEQSELLKTRTMAFALDVARLLQDLPAYEPGPTVRRQLAKASTSVAANDRAACRARSHAEFTAKIGLVAEEADESGFWIDFAIAGVLVSKERWQPVQREASELTAIFARSYGTARANRSS